MLGAVYTVSLKAVKRNEAGAIEPDNDKPDIELTPRPISLQVGDSLDYWIRRRYVRAVELTVADVEDELAKRLAIVEATKEAQKLTWTNREGMQFLNCIEGMSLLLYLTVKDSNPALTLASLQDLLAYAPNYLELTTRLAEYNLAENERAIELFRQALANSLRVLQATKATNGPAKH